MAYVVAQAPAARTAREALAVARWNRLAASAPELAPAVRLQAQLLELALDLLDAVENGHVPRLSMPARYLAAKLRRGIPALTAEPLPIPATVLGPSLSRLCRILEQGGAGAAAAHVAAALDEGRIEAGSLLTASLARDETSIRRGAEHLGLAPDLVWLVAELAAGPYAHALQQRIFGTGEAPALAAALDGWNAGYCPACGSWPALAERVGGQAVLRCSFCALPWALTTERCLYCRAEPPAFRVMSVSNPDRALAACQSCGGYLKIAAVDGLSPFPLVAVTDLETADLDVEAMRQGLRRPAMAARAS
jgi:formate dehydrogenase maturation protein FdhE